MEVKEFVAFSRKLLRVLKHIDEALNTGDIDTAKELISELIADTEKDTQA